MLRDTWPAWPVPGQCASGGWYVPHTSRSASHTSPTVALACSADRSGYSTLALPSAAVRSSSRPRLTAASSRPARSAASRADCAYSMAGSTRSGW